MYKYHYIAQEQRIMMKNIITKEHEIVIITQSLYLLFTGYFLLSKLFSVHIKLNFIWITKYNHCTKEQPDNEINFISQIKNRRCESRAVHRTQTFYLLLLSPILKEPSTFAPALIITLLPTVGWRFPCSFPVPPSVTP